MEVLRGGDLASLSTKMCMFWSQRVLFNSCEWYILWTEYKLGELQSSTRCKNYCWPRKIDNSMAPIMNVVCMVYLQIFFTISPRARMEKNYSIYIVIIYMPFYDVYIKIKWHEDK